MLGTIIVPFTEKVFGDHNYEVLTSSRNGIQRQSEHFAGKQRHDTDGYNVIPRGYCTYRNRSDDGLFTFNMNNIVDEGIVSKFYPVFTFQNANSSFMIEYLNGSPRVRAKLSVLAVGTSQVVLSFETLKETSFYLPTFEEQNRIAALLSTLNERIEKQRLLIEHLKKYKRGVLKAILEQRLRFKRSNGENYPKWESYTISEITDCLDRRRVPITSNERIKGAYPYYGANGIQDYVADYIFDGEFVLLAEDGGHFNDFATEPIAQYVSGKIWVNNHAHILQAKCNTHFLFYALVHKDIRNYINNPSRGKLNQEDMQGIVIDVPCKEEQERIVDFMLKIDQNIEAKLNTLNQLVDFKKGLLQQLFI